MNFNRELGHLQPQQVALMDVEIDGQIVKRPITRMESGPFGVGLRPVPETRGGEDVIYYLGRGIPTIVRMNDGH